MGPGCDFEFERGRIPSGSFAHPGAVAATLGDKGPTSAEFTTAYPALGETSATRPLRISPLKGEEKELRFPLILPWEGGMHDTSDGLGTTRFASRTLLPRTSGFRLSPDSQG